MFENFSIAEFDKREADIYLKSLVAIAYADFNLNEKEKEYIHAQAELLGLPVKDYLNNTETDLSFLDNSEFAKKYGEVLLRDCMILAHLDEDYSVIEKQQIMRIAEMLNVDISVVEQIEAWLMQHLGSL